MLSAHLGGADVREALRELEEHYRERGVRLVERGRRWQFQTAPDLAHLLRREVPGRPVIYATTPEFLSHFGLDSRRDLPGIDELKAAGLLDPVDEALEALTSGAPSQSPEPEEDERADFD
jgi:chromosome segregation and condensation protein ScpB